MASQYLTMSITSIGPASIPNQEAPIHWRNQKITNDVSDIEGARPKVLHKPLCKPQFSNDEIPGSTSKLLHHERNTRDMTLYIDDIEGARHRVKNRMLKTNRQVNPLDPQYPLPSFEHLPPEQPKFIKCSLDHSDIEKSKPKPTIFSETRETMKIDDIEGTSPGWKSLHETIRKNNPPHEIMKVQDISQKDHRWVDRFGQNRMVNTLDPTYYVHGMLIQDDQRYTKPKNPKPLITENHLLQTQDINHPPEAVPPPRREYRNINYIGDIDGAQHDTIRPGISTKRQTNPLNPLYQSLDDGEIIPPVVQPLIPAEKIWMPTLKPPKSRGITTASETTRTHFDPSFTVSQPLTRASSSPRMGGRSDFKASTTSNIFGGSESRPQSPRNSTSGHGNRQQHNQIQMGSSPPPSSESRPRTSSNNNNNSRISSPSSKSARSNKNQNYNNSLPPLPIGANNQQIQNNNMNISPNFENFQFYPQPSPTSTLFGNNNNNNNNNDYYSNNSNNNCKNQQKSGETNPTLTLSQFNNTITKGNHHHPPPIPNSTSKSNSEYDLIPGKLRDLNAGGVSIGSKVGQREREREITKQQQKEIRKERQRELEALQRDIESVRELF